MTTKIPTYFSEVSDPRADAFCQLHSIAETARKNGQDIFLAFIAVANNHCQATEAE